MPRFRILRYFSVSSFFIVAVAAIVLALIYRYVAIKGIVQLGERGNIALAQTALNSLQPHLLGYLAQVEKAGNAADLNLHQPGHTLEREIQQVLRDTTVRRIKIYNRNGIVAFSTKGEQIGHDQSGNPGFITAMRGQIASKLIYRDSLNVFDETTEDDNLIQTYLPVSAGPTAPIQGVFEIYTDVNALVNEAERAEITIMLGSGLVLLLLYGALLVIVRRADRVIESQQDIIRERSRTLELLSAKLLTAQESEKKRIAGDLHEGIAQTLAAVKARLESALSHTVRNRPRESAETIQPLIPLIQQAIQEVRALATDLRPASLDELGIADTISWYSRHFHEVHPEIRLESRVDIDERDISVSLRVIIYRILQGALEAIARHGRTNMVCISLEREQDTVVLGIEDDSLPPRAGEGDLDRRIALAALQERATLSGGSVQLTTRPQGGTTIRVSWPV
jgi:signal transduction histidine kinase